MIWLWNKRYYNYLFPIWNKHGWFNGLWFWTLEHQMLQNVNAVKIYGWIHTDSLYLNTHRPIKPMKYMSLPRIVRLLYYMYTHQQYYVKWNNERSNLFNVSNGVKQGSVISPLLFSIYIDELFSKLEYLGSGCHVGLTYASAFGYADDIALISPTIYSLKNMLKVCESFAIDYHITFNTIKSKLILHMQVHSVWTMFIWMEKRSFIPDGKIKNEIEYSLFQINIIT